MTDRGTVTWLPGSRWRTTLQGLPGTLRRNWFFAVVLGLGLVLRLMTWLAYQPAMLYIDSFRYLSNLGPMAMDRIDPIGYTLILWPLLYGGNLFGAGLAFTTAIQHLLGLAIGVVMYRICRGLGTVRWLSAVVTVPVLLDGYQLQIEQNLMAEVWSDAFLLAAVWFLLAWRLRRRGVSSTCGVGSGPLWWQAGAAGLLIGGNVAIRVIGAAAVVPLVAYLVFVGASRRDRAWWRTMMIRTAAGLAGFGIVMAGYLGAYRGVTAPGGLSDGGALLYGRAAQVAKCDQLPLDKYLAQVCPKQPVGQRLGVDAYAWDNWKPTAVRYLPPDGTQAQLRIQFTKLVLQHQPLAMLDGMAQDFLKGFAWTKAWSPGDPPLYRWQFQTDYPRWPTTDADLWTQRFDHVKPQVIKPFAVFLRGYQLSVGYTPGTILGGAGLVGVAGMLRRRRSGVSLRAESMLAVGISLALLTGSAVFEFSWRYQLPGLVFLPLAAGIGLTGLVQRDGREASPRSLSPN